MGAHTDQGLGHMGLSRILESLGLRDPFFPTSMDSWAPESTCLSLSKAELNQTRNPWS